MELPADDWKTVVVRQRLTSVSTKHAKATQSVRSMMPCVNAMDMDRRYEAESNFKIREEVMTYTPAFLLLWARERRKGQMCKLSASMTLARSPTSISEFTLDAGPGGAAQMGNATQTGVFGCPKAERDADSSRTSVPGPKIEPAKMCLTKCIMHPRHSYLSPRPVGA